MTGDLCNEFKYHPSKKSWRKIARYCSDPTVSKNDLLQCRAYIVKLIAKCNTAQVEHYEREAKCEFTNILFDIDDKLESLILKHRIDLTL